VNRRGFLAAGCACAVHFAPGLARAQTDWVAPPRFMRPELASDEGGLWSMMDREETKLRRSPFAIRDHGLRDYVQSVACRLVADHCPNIRVHLVRTPLFNANVAPNGMMQLWSGLLLRMENEAQLAAVLGHEIGHYLERHALERMRDAKSRSAFGQFLGLFGVVGAVGQLTMLAGALAYSRDQERDADRIGIALMHKAGYDATEAVNVWSNLLLEIKARPGGAGTTPMFATHPSPEERQETLARLAQVAPGGVTNEDAWQARMRPFRFEWLMEEVKRGQHEESIALLTRMISRAPAQAADALYARGEVYRLRAQGADLDAAEIDFQTALTLSSAPPEAHRALGMIYRLRGQHGEARESFKRYLELAPAAPDIPLIKSYMEEMPA
jgi:beta-barrel assembly-enhancing protease